MRGVAILLCAPTATLAVTIPTVPVGNPGNSGPGAVAYNYRIGTTEVTNAQYAEFLNAKAASDPLRLYMLEMGLLGGITRSGPCLPEMPTPRWRSGHTPRTWLPARRRH